MLSACGGTRLTPRPAKTPEPALHQGPLTDFVPAAGLRWMAVARPKELLQDRSVRQGIERLFPNARLDVFAQNSGIDLRTLDVGLVAGFDLGTLYLAETPAVEAAKKAFLNRLASEPVTKQLGPEVVHITGLIGVTPESFVGISNRVVGIGVKDPSLTKIAGAFALGKLKRSPSALLGAALHELPTSLSADPLEFYAPGPFSDEWEKGAHGLLRNTVCVGITARINKPGILHILVLLEGDYGEDSNATVDKALATFRELADNALGRLLSLNEPDIAPEIVATPRQVTLQVRVPIERLLDGLYAVVAANVWDLLDYRPR